MKIIDNFLDSSHFELIEEYLLGNNLPWHYNDCVVEEDDGGYQFIHAFYNDSIRNRYDNSPYKSKYCRPVKMDAMLRKMGAEKILRIKANLNPQTSFPKKSLYHIDYCNRTTGIFYVNTNNGYTEFKNGDKVESVANRLVIFDSNREHRGVTCTDQKRRVVINFNWA